MAIKKIPSAFDDVVDAKRIVREVRLLRRLDHMNIIKIVDILPPPSLAEFNDVYIVSELMDTDLHRVIYSSQVRQKKRKRLSARGPPRSRIPPSATSPSVFGLCCLCIRKDFCCGRCCYCCPRVRALVIPHPTRKMQRRCGDLLRPGASRLGPGATNFCDSPASMEILAMVPSGEEGLCSERQASCCEGLAMVGASLAHSSLSSPLTLPRLCVSLVSVAEAERSTREVFPVSDPVRG